MLGVLRNKWTNRIHSLPVLVLMPHSRCNCRCVMCDIWKANNEKKELTTEELSKHVDAIASWNVREILLSGGEPLMHKNLWSFISLLKEKGNPKISMLSTGLLLEKNASQVVRYCDEVIVSMDGSPAIHDKIRNIPAAFDKLRAGVQAVKKLSPGFRITARAVIQKHNFHDFTNMVTVAKEIGLDQISFLAADVSTAAFNRDEPWNENQKADIALNREETGALDQIVRESFAKFHQLYESKFIAESPEKILRIVNYYQAINGTGSFSSPKCNAPWVSAVVESNGDVMPCFFHQPFGNLFQQSLEKILNSDNAITFRKTLNVATDPICKKCVCSLYKRF